MPSPVDAYGCLAESTREARGFLLSAPIIQRTLRGEVTRELYVAFLTQAYHHVKHTVPLLMAVGSRLDDSREWLRSELVHYVEEEHGHEQWILNDIAASGGDAEGVRRSKPQVETDAMVAYAYDVAMRRNPVGCFGMVFVLEGTSVALALEAASRIQSALALPDRAFSYLRSHGKLDQEHTQHLAGIVNRLDAPTDQEAITSCANAMFWLYGNVFRSLERVAA
ncbi:MAG: iron-containing redox enzyme family protein [Gammaproteobacteria bacterium]|nr:iron-containing redox enzyme family protein [Gammaproteobacteria bacterium]